MISFAPFDGNPVMAALTFIPFTEIPCPRVSEACDTARDVRVR